MSALRIALSNGVQMPQVGLGSNTRRLEYTLPNDKSMPALGLGTWQSRSDEVKSAVSTALDAGYRLIDTAEVYGNETPIGEVLHDQFSAGKLKRDDVFVTTKCWRSHLRPGETVPACRESLRQLQLDYVDLYLAHMPTAGKLDPEKGETVHDPTVSVEDIWRALEEVYDAGLARAIGVSNFSLAQMERIVKIARVPVHNLQVECHIYFPQHELHDFCKRHNITFTAYAPLGSPGRKAVVPRGQSTASWPDAPNPFEDDDVIALTKKYGKTPAQILLRQLVQRGIAVIPKSVNEARIKENLAIDDFELTKEEVDKLAHPGKVQRLFMQTFQAGHPEDPYKSERS